MYPHRRSAVIVLYFLLNLYVTFTNKKILSLHTQDATDVPYLLTAVHATTSFVGSTIATRMPSSKRPLLTYYQHLCLATFSLFYMINIAFSNLSLGLVDLSTHQTVRATAPVLTVVVSIVVLGRSWRIYSVSTYAAIILITLGVIIATSRSPSPTVKGGTREKESMNMSLFGIAVTLLGTLTAVTKTILIHKLTTNLSLSLKPMELLQVLSPYAAAQAFLLAYRFHAPTTIKTISTNTDTVTTTTNLAVLTQSENKVSFGATTLRSFWSTITQWHHHHHYQHQTDHAPSSPSYHTNLPLWTSNAVAAFLLNVASFEANKTNGPTSMAVAANLKQIVVLVLPVVAGRNGGGSNSLHVLIGSLMTVAGGSWYAIDTARMKERIEIQKGVQEKS